MLSPQDWKRVEELFSHARELDAEARTELLQRELGERDDLRAVVVSMLAANDEDPGFLEPVPAQDLLEALESERGGFVGRRLGAFVLGEELGRGGMGVVHRAVQDGLAREVAVKVLPPLRASDAEAVERFRREAVAASKLRHPGVVPVHAAGEEDGVVFFAMELVDGWSLAELLDDRREGRAAREGAPDLDDPRTAAAIAARMADAVAHAHAQGVLHRDVKPSNVLIGRDDLRPRLIDFGLARVEELDSLSRSGEPAGTPLYMSPEQVRARKSAVDHRTDVYSIGAVLYELLTGSPPFPGRATHEVLYKIANAPLTPVRSRRAGVPQAVARIAEAALRRRREDRYETAADLRDSSGGPAASTCTASRCRWSAG